SPFEYLCDFPLDVDVASHSFELAFGVINDTPVATDRVHTAGAPLLLQAAYAAGVCPEQVAEARLQHEERVIAADAERQERQEREAREYLKKRERERDGKKGKRDGAPRTKKGGRREKNDTAEKEEKRVRRPAANFVASSASTDKALSDASGYDAQQTVTVHSQNEVEALAASLLVSAAPFVPSTPSPSSSGIWAALPATSLLSASGPEAAQPK
ncbi:hypothetical protein KIPB_013792, partial [Kipferlia bialata]